MVWFGVFDLYVCCLVCLGFLAVCDCGGFRCGGLFVLLML